MEQRERRTERLRISLRKDRNREIGMIIWGFGNGSFNVFWSWGGLRITDLLILSAACFNTKSFLVPLHVG